MRKFIFMVLVFFIFAGYGHADTAWKDVTPNINCREFKCITVCSDDPKAIYLGTTDGVFESKNSGLNWEQIFTGRYGEKAVNHIAASKDFIILATDGGIIVSSDEGRKWKSLSGMISGQRVYSIAASDKTGANILIVTREGIFKKYGPGDEWIKIMASGSDGRKIDESPRDGNNASIRAVRSVSIGQASKGCIYAGTDDGVYFSIDGGDIFSRFNDNGLVDKHVVLAMESPLDPGKLYAVTKTGIFYFAEETWHSLEMARHIRGLRSMAIDGEGAIWVVSKNNIYRSVKGCTSREKADIEFIGLLARFDKEPTINETQEMAIRYTETNPEKIRGWRNRANLNAILPRLSVGYDINSTDTYEIYTSSSKQYSYIGPKKHSDGWDITLTWNLGELIWNNDQTLIDVRSKLMVQLRDDILDEVTAYYFERRRLQMELLETSPKTFTERSKKQLRIQELTANIDALTGGLFSRKLNKI